MCSSRARRADGRGAPVPAHGKPSCRARQVPRAGHAPGRARRQGPWCPDRGHASCRHLRSGAWKRHVEGTREAWERLRRGASLLPWDGHRTGSRCRIGRACHVSLLARSASVLGGGPHCPPSKRFEGEMKRRRKGAFDRLHQGRGMRLRTAGARQPVRLSMPRRHICQCRLAGRGARPQSGGAKGQAAFAVSRRRRSVGQLRMDSRWQ